MQDLLNALCLLGNNSGGSRTIAIMASFYRALMKYFCPAIRDWDMAKGKFWDSALAGNSSLRAAVERALKVENGVARGAQIGHLLCAMKKVLRLCTAPYFVRGFIKARVSSRAYGARILHPHSAKDSQSWDVFGASGQQLWAVDVGWRPTVGQLDPSPASRLDGNASGRRPRISLQFSRR